MEAHESEGIQESQMVKKLAQGQETSVLEPRSNPESAVPDTRAHLLCPLWPISVGCEGR